MMVNPLHGAVTSADFGQAPDPAPQKRFARVRPKRLSSFLVSSRRP